MAESVRQTIEELPAHEKCLRHSHDEGGNAACFEDADEKELRTFGYKFMHEPTKQIDVSQCEGCERFVNRYIDFPLVVEDIEKSDPTFDKPLGNRHGDLVRVRPCGEEYGGKTYLGILVAEAPTGISVSYDDERRVLKVSTALSNPLIVIPETHSLVWGYESWWETIKDPSDLGEITDEDIENVWYVKAIRELCKRDQEEE